MTYEEVQRSAPLPAIARPKAPTGQAMYSAGYLIAELQMWAASHDGLTPRNMDWNRAHARKHGVRFESGWPSTQAVIIHFGSWRAGIAAAGLNPRRTGAPQRHETECVICGRSRRITHGRHYLSGSDGRCHNCSYYLKRTGREWTPEVPAQAAAARLAKAHQNREGAIKRAERLISLRAAGMSNLEIGEREGIRPAQVASILSRARARGQRVPTSPYMEKGRRRGPR